MPQHGLWIYTYLPLTIYLNVNLEESGNWILFLTIKLCYQWKRCFPMIYSNWLTSVNLCFNIKYQINVLKGVTINFVGKRSSVFYAKHVSNICFWFLWWFNPIDMRTKVVLIESLEYTSGVTNLVSEWWKDWKKCR